MSNTLLDSVSRFTIEEAADKGSHGGRQHRRVLKRILRVPVAKRSLA